MRLVCGTRTLDLSRPVVMGILNVTPDSFSDGGRFFDPDLALKHALRMREEGAAIIDVGGESTRPGSEPVPADEEIRRVVPVIQRLAAETDAIISVDTSKPEVMRAAADAGAHIINDVYALRLPGALEAAAATGCAVCLMHMQGEPRTMQAAPQYRDVTGEVLAFLEERVAACTGAGIERGRIAIDPGFGFGKTAAHNVELLAGLRRLLALELPLTVGLSRKSTLGKLTGRTVDERMPAGVATAVLAVERGAHIVRTHDVGPTVDAIRVAGAVMQSEGFREP